MTSTPLKPTTKMLGDAGEHYALSQFTFAGKPATKMPDNWKGYDLAVETGSGLARVSVKTRSESEGWRTSKWFNFDERRECDWIVLLFKPKTGSMRSWIVPFADARQHANVPGPNRKNAHFRDLSWSKLNKPPLSVYEDNWNLLTVGSPVPRAATKFDSTRIVLVAEPEGVAKAHPRPLPESRTG